MTVTGDPAPEARPLLRQPVADGPVVALLLLLPACIWWINFGAPWILPGEPGWRWSAALIALGVWLLAAVGAALRKATGPGIAASISARSLLSAVGTVVYLLLGAGFLVVLGPGIAPARSSVARALVGALMLACAWTGWSALHPGARRPALRILVRLFRRS